MKKLLWILIVWALAMACGQDSGSAEKSEAAAEEDVDIGSGEEINPQLELDSSDTRFEVDTISSPREAQDESESDDF